MAYQYQEQQSYEQHDNDYEEPVRKQSGFNLKKYIKNVCIVGSVLGLLGYGCSYIVDHVIDTQNYLSSTDEIVVGDGIIDQALTNEFTLNGQYYSFPCTLQTFLDQGWEYTDYSSDLENQKIKKDQYEYIYLENDQHQEISLRVSSPTGKKINMNDAYVVSLNNYETYDVDQVDITISGGIYTGMKCSDLDALLNENDWKHTKSTISEDWYYSLEVSDKDNPYEISYSINTEKENGERIVKDISIHAYENYDYKY